MIKNKKNLVVIAWLVVSTMMSAQSVYLSAIRNKTGSNSVARAITGSAFSESFSRDNMLRGFGMDDFLLM